MRILRVFPQRTSYTPTDSMVAIGDPPFKDLIPPHDEIHISCIFSWDKDYCKFLQHQWQGQTNKPVLLGGPAFGSKATDFNQGLYMKSNIVFTSRGCNNQCPWCIVHQLEGKLKELPISIGNIVQDNNFLQTNKDHQQKVLQMLRTQNGICLKGGLEAALITDNFADELNGFYYTRGGKRVSRIAELWLACDTDESLPAFKRAVEKLAKRGFSREKIKCYALIGDNMEKNEARLREIYSAGAMPFAQLFQPLDCDKKKVYSDDWKAFHRMWSRPAATRAHIEKGTNYWEYNT